MTGYLYAYKGEIVYDFKKLPGKLIAIVNTPYEDLERACMSFMEAVNGTLIEWFVDEWTGGRWVLTREGFAAYHNGFVRLEGGI